MNKLILSALVALLALTSCTGSKPKQTPEDIVIRTPHEKLITRMDTLRTHGAMYGHQDDPFYGVTWQWEKDRSDTKELLGDYPAVMGFDLGGLEEDHTANLDSVPFDWIRREAILQHKRGGIITFSWHPRNPRTGGNAWDVSDTTVVRHILPGGEQHDLFVSWMKKVATFLKEIRLEDGTPIPFILRPWHEYNGSWFWWGQNLCSDSQFVQLWCMFQDYMNKEMPSNIVWSFSPNMQGTWTEESFLTRYPGNERVDLLGCDAYQWGTEEQFTTGLKLDLEFLTAFAETNHKLFAMTECGKQNSPTADWWGRVFLPLIDPYPVCYFLPWRNWGAEHFGLSKDVPTADDARQLYEQQRFMILKDIIPALGQTGRDSEELLLM